MVNVGTMSLVITIWGVKEENEDKREYGSINADEKFN
jgi:hypothetical protein